MPRGGEAPRQERPVGERPSDRRTSVDEPGLVVPHPRVSALNHSVLAERGLEKRGDVLHLLLPQRLPGKRGACAGGPQRRSHGLVRPPPRWRAPSSSSSPPAAMHSLGRPRSGGATAAGTAPRLQEAREVRHRGARGGGHGATTTAGAAGAGRERASASASIPCANKQGGAGPARPLQARGRLPGLVALAQVPPAQSVPRRPSSQGRAALVLA